MYVEAYVVVHRKNVNSNIIAMDQQRTPVSSPFEDFLSQIIAIYSQFVPNIHVFWFVSDSHWQPIH